jgi:hypothetical protein
VNKWRTKHPDFGKPVKKTPPDDDSGSHDAELTEAAGSVYSEAEKHREGVIARDKAAQARKKKGTRR